MRRVSPSMAVALLALFVALGGSGYAATRVNGRTIVNRSISGSKLKHNTLTGAQINESRLGTVPSASDSDFLNGRPASAYVLADGGVAATAREALLLDGQSASAFLPASGTAVNASALGGQPASAFLGATATAANAAAVQGHPASDFLPAGKVLAAGPVRLGPGQSATLFSSGQFVVVARCAAGQATIVLQHPDNIFDPTATGNVNLVPGGDTPLVIATFSSGDAAIQRVPFGAFTLGAGLQGVATATATANVCEAAAFGVAS